MKVLIYLQNSCQKPDSLCIFWKNYVLSFGIFGQKVLVIQGNRSDISVAVANCFQEEEYFRWTLWSVEVLTVLKETHLKQTVAN